MSGAYRIDLEIPRDQHRGRARVVVRDTDGQIVTTDCAQLWDGAERRRLARALAKRLRGDAEELAPLLEERWAKALTTAEQAPPEPPDAPVGPRYHDADGYLVWMRPTRDGDVPVPLANFTARIVEQTLVDDGVERRVTLAVEGQLADDRPLPRVELAADEYAGMRWPVAAWGTSAVVHAGAGTADHVRVAIQLLSGDVPTRTVYAHLGWRKVGESWVYLHAGGAIGAAGLDEGVPVSLPEALAGFHLPAPPEGADLAAAVRASLGFLCLGPDRATFPLLAAVYRAVLEETDFGHHLAGPTGCYKSEAAALAQQHFGASMDARHLPACWSSTGNALEGLAFFAKDALLVVDDFCPSGSTADVQRYHKEADRLFRAQGNRAGRQRMRADASLRPAKPPRGLVLSTGEDTPRGQSLRARLWVQDISPGDFGPEPPDPNPALTACQRDAAAGLYAAAMAGYLRWLAPQLDAIRPRLRNELAELRDRARGEGQHARTPGIVANLALGLRYLLDFAQTTGAVSENEREELWERGWNALGEVAATQREQIATGEPAGLFLRLLEAALASGYAHVADEHGNEPPEPQRWGWRPEDYFAGKEEGESVRYKPQGVRVGWLADGEVFLEPDASFAAVQRFARDQNESFAISAITLRRRLKEQGLLATTDAGRGKLTVRKTLQGARRDVLHVAWTSAPSAPQTGPIGPEGDGGGKKGSETWAGSWAGNREANGHSAQKAAAAGTLEHSPAAIGPDMGGMGRLHVEEEETSDAKVPKQQADWGDWQ
jgi:hypothetical protein